MIILAVDSSGPVVSAAVSKEDKILYEAAANCGLTHSETMQPMIEQVVRGAGISPDEVDLFACVTGPGSFTGVRIGVCAVKAMAQALDRPCVALNALEVLAAGKYGFIGTICPILDARREQVYAAAYSFSEGEVPKIILAEDALPLLRYLEKIPEGRLLFVGDGVPVHKEKIRGILGERALFSPDCTGQLRCGVACYLAARKPTCDAMALAPLYLRRPQAEREREARLHGGKNV
ncbi:MAG: tRNA (adenosine(37)-N6)-threonylcarbamoyltransferase complex dimerization subunit type 1 TsaB [Candidatus Excrementavichristensenella sp.]|jgi:tRNA threonylcarbamoyladenosine biosynthesis protein TsaB